jgi:hypothetical protein
VKSPFPTHSSPPISSKMRTLAALSLVAAVAAQPPPPATWYGAYRRGISDIWSNEVISSPSAFRFASRSPSPLFLRTQASRRTRPSAVRCVGATGIAGSLWARSHGPAGRSARFRRKVEFPRELHPLCLSACVRAGFAGPASSRPLHSSVGAAVRPRQRGPYWVPPSTVSTPSPTHPPPHSRVSLAPPLLRSTSSP